MGSLPTGSDKLLEIQSGNIYVVIKSKNPHPNLTNKSILQQPSELRVTGVDVNSVRIFGEEKIAADNGAVGASFYSIHTSPLFFEQTDYEVIVKSRDGKSVSLWHENYSIRDKISPVTDSDDLISGIVNFGNSASFSDFEISHDGKKSLVVRIEVFPSKISYKEDYQDMLQDISNEIAGAVLDFMRNTYQEFSIGSTQNTVPALFFEIIKRIFDKFQNAANTIISSPHHKLYVEHPIVPAHKVKKIDTLEKKGSNVPYKYVFDAKYRIENNPSDPFYPDTKPGPKVSDINTMHRYRDSIVYESDTPSRFMFEKTMFGAYVLFPYDDPDGEYKNHRFYKSIETVNIGGLPFLPGTTELLENFLAELVADSSESAFERASLPRGIEERLAKVDWTVRDVMVGSLGSVAQFDDNIRRKYYYVPAKYINDSHLPIHYVALYQSRNRFKEYAGIRYYGEVTYMKKVKRKDIDFPMSRNNGDEWYYAFRIKEWKTLSSPIAVKDEWVNEPKFTSLFLLEHSQQSFELFNIHSEEEYRLMVEINKAFDNLSTSTTDNNSAVYRINDSHSVIVADGNFTITNDNGEILGSISISNFARSPRAGFRTIKKLMH